ncbi:unnamed protein product, partial [Closterium sp. NIES-54]
MSPLLQCFSIFSATLPLSLFPSFPNSLSPSSFPSRPLSLSPLLSHALVPSSTITSLPSLSPTLISLFFLLSHPHRPSSPTPPLLSHPAPPLPPASPLSSPAWHSPPAHFVAQLLNACGMRGTISISISRSISRGTAPAYTIRFGAAVAGADSPPSNLLLSLPRGAPPLVLCRGSAECQWVATTPSVWEVAGERRMRGVDVRQARVLEEMLTAVGEGGGSGEDSAVVGEGSDAVAGYGVRAAAAVEGGDEGQYDLVGALQRSREYSHDIIIPRYPPEDPRLEVRLEGGMGGMGGMGDMGEMGERGEMTEGLSGGVCGGAFMLGAFKDGHVVVNYDIRVIGPAQKPSAINLIVDYPDPSSFQAASLRVASLQCDSWTELKPQMWRAQCSSRWSSSGGSSSAGSNLQGRLQNMSEDVFNRFACFAVDGSGSPSVAVLSVAIGASGTSVVGASEAGSLAGGIAWRAPHGGVEEREQQREQQGQEQQIVQSEQSEQRDSGAATVVAAASLKVPDASASFIMDVGKAERTDAAGRAGAGEGADAAEGAESATATRCEHSELPCADDDTERTNIYWNLRFPEPDIDVADIRVRGSSSNNIHEVEFNIVIKGANNEDEREAAEAEAAGDVVGLGLGDVRRVGAEAEAEEGAVAEAAAFMPSPP